MFKRSIALATMLAFVAMQAVAIAGEHKKQSSSGDHEHEGEHVTYEGTLVCLGCTLKGDGARSQCTDFGHDHAIMVDEETMVMFLPNKYSADLIAGGNYDKKAIMVTGTYYANANMLDVEMFEVDGKKYGWCDHCSAMDGCPFAMDMEH